MLTKHGENAIPCTLEVNEMMGSELHLHVFTDDGTSLVVQVPTNTLGEAARKGLVAEAMSYITFESKVMHFFDPESTEYLPN